jgi:hypothetical protein
MPFGFASEISISAPACGRDGGRAEVAARLAEIAALEAANFALRNHVTGLKLHNATVRRLLRRRAAASATSGG